MALLRMAQERLMNKVRVYQDEIAKQELRSEACPLLAHQLRELLVLAARLKTNAEDLLLTLDKE